MIGLIWSCWSRTRPVSRNLMPNAGQILPSPPRRWPCRRRAGVRWFSLFPLPYLCWRGRRRRGTRPVWAVAIETMSPPRYGALRNAPRRQARYEKFLLIGIGISGTENCPATRVLLTGGPRGLPHARPSQARNVDVSQKSLCDRRRASLIVVFPSTRLLSPSPEPRSGVKAEGLTAMRHAERQSLRLWRLGPHSLSSPLDRYSCP